MVNNGFKAVFVAAMLSATMANAQLAYKVIYPSGGDDYPAISAALAKSATQPVQLALNPAFPTRGFGISRGLTIPSGGTLKCENANDNNGNPGQIIISAYGSFTGSAFVTTTGNDARVIGCVVYGGGSPAGTDCFANSGNAPIFDSIGAMYCPGIGLNLTSHSGNVVLPRLVGHSAFYNSTGNAIAVHWDANGSVSDILLEGALVGTNCTGGCGGEGDVYIYGSNGSVRNMRVEWSWNSGFWCDACDLNFNGNFFDRPGGEAIHLRGSAYLNISGNLIEGMGRAVSPQYASPAIVFEQDQFGRVPSVRIEGTSIQRWSSQASYFLVKPAYYNPFGSGLISVDGNGIQPTPYGIYQNQFTHDTLVPFVLAPPAYPQ